MSEQEFLLPGYYKVIAANLSPYGSTARIDISAIIHKIVIEESIENDSIRGYISVADGVGLLEKLPLRGEERLLLEVEDVLKNKKIFDLFVYKVEDVLVKEANDIIFYDMVFVSYTRWNAGTRKIIKAFDGLISNTVKELFDAYYIPNNRPLEIEPTEGDFYCVIPNYSPPQALKFLANRSYSKVSPSCSYRFFENSESYYFVTDEWLIAEAIRTNNVKEFTYVPYSNPMDITNTNNKTSFDLEAQMRNLIELRNTDRINTVADLTSGAYKNNPIVIDFVNKTVTDNRYSYEESKTEFASLNAGNKNIEDVHQDSFINRIFTDENEKRFLVFKDYQSEGDLPTTIRSEQYLPKIISRRTTYRYMLYRNTIYVKSHGRLDLKAGDIVNLRIPEITPGENKTDSKLAGNYIVHDCTHTFDKEVYEVSMMLTKFDWREN
jgi:hypothetical protein